MRRGASLLALCALAVLLPGCAYRIRSPTPLGETLRVQVVGDHGRFPRAGALLQAKTAEAIPTRTGWAVRPDGSARLDLSLDQDRVRAKADDSRGVPTRWEIELQGTALLVTRQGMRTFRFTGTGYASGRDQEQVALANAAADAASAISYWLDRVDLTVPGKKL